MVLGKVHGTGTVIDAVGDPVPITDMQTTLLPLPELPYFHERCTMSGWRVGLRSLINLRKALDLKVALERP